MNAGGRPALGSLQCLLHRGIRGRERDKPRDRETGLQRDRVYRETERQRDRETERQGGIERQGDRETGRQRDRETERQRDREAERQIEKHRRRQTETDREPESMRDDLIPLRSVCYIEALEGEFAYDDGAAIVKNKDVNGNNSNAYTDIWSHDFWGQDLRNESSHKSYRPLTTLSFKWQYQFSQGEQIILTKLTALSRLFLSIDSINSPKVGLRGRDREREREREWVIE